MSKDQLELIQNCGILTELTGCILHNCDYCEDQGMDVTETLKSLRWILTGAVRDLQKTNARLERELKLWSPND